MNASLCPVCRSVIAQDAPAGLCPGCLFNGALRPEPKRFGRYEVLEKLGRGGMGTVFLARDPEPDRLVALKTISTGLFAEESEVARFKNEIQAMGRLDHPHIVRVYDGSGVQDECAFYTMQLIGGGTLADPRWREHFSDPRKAAALMIAIAEAVHFGHCRGVLHRDLKPQNILMDEEARPYVADFGVARLVDTAEASATGNIVGTPQYLSPEQAAGGKATITTAADVYGLGAIFYELLTGAPPFVAASVPELLRRIAEDEPAPPRSVNRKVPADLEAVCMTALKKDPELRYATASAFAEDLGRALRGEPIQTRAFTPWAKGLWLVRRHPAAFGAAFAAVALLVAQAIAARAIIVEQEQALRADAVRMNAFAATAQAGAVLHQLRTYADHLEKAAREPEVRALFREPEYVESPPVLARYARETYHAIFAVTPEGRLQARFPLAPKEHPARSFRFRDYFRSAKRLAELERSEATVAGTFRSTADGLLAFALTVPVFAPSGEWLGVLAASKPVSSAFGDVQMLDATNRERFAVLLAPDGATEAPQEEYRVLIHPGVTTGTEYLVPIERSRRLRAAFGRPRAHDPFHARTEQSVTDDDYRDPVPGYAGRWIAAFAPVGNTGLVVLVQTRYEHVARPSNEALWKFSRVGLPLSFALFAVAVFVGRGLWRKKM